mgnify:CR=1 FL=1
MVDWIVLDRPGSAYIFDQRLKNNRVKILVTYETPSGRRYVKAVECTHGHINKNIGGDIIAWMFLPEPYRGRGETDG